MIRLTGLWLNKRKDGTTFMSGSLGPLKVFVFKTNKKSENGPDYDLVIAPAEPKEGNGKGKRESEPKPNQAPDEIPF